MLIICLPVLKEAGLLVGDVPTQSSVSLNGKAFSVRRKGHHAPESERSCVGEKPCVSGTLTPQEPGISNAEFVCWWASLQMHFRTRGAITKTSFRTAGAMGRTFVGAGWWTWCWGRGNSVQAESNPKAAVEVTVRGRVRVAGGGAAVPWVVAPRAAAQHARPVSLFC